MKTKLDGYAPDIHPEWLQHKEDNKNLVRGLMALNKMKKGESVKPKLDKKKSEFSL